MSRWNTSWTLLQMWRRKQKRQGSHNEEIQYLWPEREGYAWKRTMEKENMSRGVRGAEEILQGKNAWLCQSVEMNTENVHKIWWLMIFSHLDRCLKSGLQKSMREEQWERDLHHLFTPQMTSKSRSGTQTKSGARNSIRVFDVVSRAPNACAILFYLLGCTMGS